MLDDFNLRVLQGDLERFLSDEGEGEVEEGRKGEEELEWTLSCGHEDELLVGSTRKVSQTADDPVVNRGIYSPSQILEALRSPTLVSFLLRPSRFSDCICHLVVSPFLPISPSTSPRSSHHMYFNDLSFSQ